ncbi:MAG: ROK family protein [Methanoregula sp.]|nr:ROK family protein [Methanoregula sp.]
MAFITEKSSGLVTTVSILTRRLKEGKTYEDFRKAWFHTTGFGVEGDDSEEGSNRMYTLINIFDPREVIVLGFANATLKQLDDALNIDVKVRGENPLDEVIEPEIGRSFCALVAEDDFSAVGYIPYCPPMIDGKMTDMQEFEKTRLALLSIFAAASQKRDTVNEARKKKK